MKKIILLLLLGINISTAQIIQKNQKEFAIINLAVDPHASITENNIDFTVDITLVSYFGYVKAGFQVFPGLTGGYLDITGGVGLNQKSTLVIAILGIDSDVRIYEGIHGGFIKRGSETYPLFGLDLGTDVEITENFYIGAKLTYDWREDFLFTQGDPSYQPNVFVTTTFKLQYMGVAHNPNDREQLLVLKDGRKIFKTHNGFKSFVESKKEK